MKRINIYITEKTKNELLHYCKKYSVSISTIADKLTNILLTKTSLKETTFTWIINGTLNKNYLDKETKNKTSIKPRINDEYLNFLENTKDTANKSRYYSNILYLLANQERLKQYYTEEQINLIKMSLGNQLANTKEPRYNYNQELRKQVRIVKQNRDYFNKILNS